MKADVVEYEHSMGSAHKLLRGETMAWWILAGFFCAFGILCAGLTLYGAALHRGHSGAGMLLLGPESGGEETRFYLWLKSMGILKCRIYLLDTWELLGIFAENGTEITDWETVSRHQTGAEEIDRAGNGDSSGNHQRGGIPEL